MAIKTSSSFSRRGFLKSTTGAGLLICSSRVAFGYQANELLNIAAIGVGGNQHLVSVMMASVLALERDALENFLLTSLPRRKLPAMSQRITSG